MIRFRLADSADATLISHIHATSWRKAYKGLVPQHFLDRLPNEYWVPSVRSWLDSERFSCLIIYEDKMPLGVCIFGRSRDERHADWGEIVSLYMLPEAFCRGLGGMLLEEALRCMQGEGYTRFCLWTLENNMPADRFYRKHGFHPTTDSEEFPLGGAMMRERRYVRITE